MQPLSLMRVSGIRIVIDPTWIVVFLLVVATLGGGYLPSVAPRMDPVETWFLGALAAVLLFASVLVHELSHALLARRAGIKVPRIRLFLFGGVSEMSAEPHEPRAELRIAAAGPLTSLTLAAIAAGLSRGLAPFGLSGTVVILDYLAASNLMLALFNLLPGLPLDGGRILRAWLWSRHGNLMRATRTAGRTGTAIGWILIALGFVSMIGGQFAAGIWMVVLGMFLSRAASSSYETALLRDSLGGLPVREVMTREVDRVDDHLSLEELVNAHLLHRPHRVFPVVANDQVVGLVSVDQVRRVPREDWVRVPVRQVMTPIALVPPVGQEDECVPILERMMRENVSPLPVVADGRLVGIVSRRDIVEAYRVRSLLAAR